MGFRPVRSFGGPVEKPNPLCNSSQPTPRFSALSADGPPASSSPSVPCSLGPLFPWSLVPLVPASYIALRHHAVCSTRKKWVFSPRDR